ncbi:hypothetical protein ROHU_005532 [Labeo rohita]|uniref:Uncharacterized protein n=1 Tax=Labeo rohita TaxID=84645 RepID=A0A498N170_LABRO|nr:hypothetical protein ROHU_005532 [Labeo rohita]
MMERNRGVIGLFFTTREKDVSQGQGKAQKDAHQRLNSDDTFHYRDVSRSTKMLYSSIVGDEATGDAAASQE